jgi:site-specific recombinase XerC
MAELLERWLEWRQNVRPISRATVMSYRGDLDRYILPALGKLPVRQLDAATLDTFYARLHTGGRLHAQVGAASSAMRLRAVVEELEPHRL